MNNLTILVMSCDRYQDCWTPYVECLHRFWPDCNCPIVLCTEQVTSELFSKTLLCNSTWSGKVIEACKQIDTELVLFTLDDFWLSQPVDTVRMETCVKCMTECQDIGVIYLDAQSKTKYPVYNGVSGIQTIPFGTPYRVSAGPAIWRVSFLKSLLRFKESAWDFERIGSFRAEGEKYLALQTTERVWARTCTMGAIERGKWERGVKAFVQQNKIAADLSGRETKSQLDCLKKAIKSAIYNISPRLILKVQNWLYLHKEQ